MKRFLKNSFTYPLKKIILLYPGWWIFWALLQTIVLHRLHFSWEISLVDSFISNGLMGLVCLVTVLLFNYYPAGAGNRSYRIISAFGIAALFNYTFDWLLQHIYASNQAYLIFLQESMPVRCIVSLMMISFVSILNGLLNLLREQKMEEVRQTETEQLMKEAELVKLRQQLQPHFLFNSLNSISALAGSKPDEARKMIQQLSDFLRGTLKKDEQQTVLLKEELQHLSLYLDIEKVRFGHRLAIDMNCDENSLQAKIPPLLLQPIVENAIKFGLYGTIGEITVGIKTHIENSNLIVEVKNPFDEQTQNVQQGTGFGLSSVQRRLFLLYSRSDLLVAKKEENIFVARLKIPQVI